jgi:transcriptional regulator with XRE-family HTH domain
MSTASEVAPAAQASLASGVGLLPARSPGRPPGLRARAGGTALREARLARGLSQNELDHAAGCRGGRISSLEGIWDAGVSVEMAHRIAQVLNVPRDHLFTPDRPPEELRGKRTRPATPPRERYDGSYAMSPEVREETRQRRHRGCDAAREAARRYCQVNALWTIQDAADFLRVDRVTVHHYLSTELLHVRETRSFGAYSLRLLSVRDVKRFGRDRYRAADRRVHLFRDPAFVLEWALKRRYGLERAKELAARARERERRYARIRTGLHPAEERHRRWSEVWAAKRRDYPDEEPNSLLGDVALLDWQQHPEDWPRHKWPSRRSDLEDLDPNVRKAARERVQKALQSTAKSS